MNNLEFLFVKNYNRNATGIRPIFAYLKTAFPTSFLIVLKTLL